MENAWSVFWYGVAALALCGFLVVAWLGARLAYRLWRAKVAAQAVAATVATGAYVLSPLDVIPDLVLGLGWLDDWVVVLLVILYLHKLWKHPRPETRVPASRATIEVVPEIPAR